MLCCGCWPAASTCCRDTVGTWLARAASCRMSSDQQLQQDDYCVDHYEWHCRQVNGGAENGSSRSTAGLLRINGIMPAVDNKQPWVRHPTGHPSSCLHSRSVSRITQRSGRDSSGSSKQQQHRPAPRMYAAACSVPMTWYFRAFGDGPMGLLPSCENPQLSVVENGAEKGPSNDNQGGSWTAAVQHGSLALAAGRCWPD